METANLTPFPVLAFESRSPSDTPFMVIAMRGTFAIAPDKPLRPIPKQEPLELVTRYYGDPQSSSMLADGDLAPFKPRSDIHVTARARAPRGEPKRSWPVRVRVGDTRKDLMVQGPSVWQHFALDGWKATRPVACREVPLTYERAYGGSFVIDGETVVEERNPVGTGFIPKGISRELEIPAAQIVAPDEPRHAAGRRQIPQGVGPLCPGWEGRLERAGTFDDEWQRTRWPCLPDDFDYAFYNSAHPDLVAKGYLRGDEQVDLVNLHAAREALSFQLPSYRLTAVAWRRTGTLLPIRLELDTVRFDLSADSPEDHRAYLTWRGLCPLVQPVLALVLRLETPGNRLVAPPSPPRDELDQARGD
jgi:hypothetical protein